MDLKICNYSTANCTTFLQENFLLQAECKSGVGLQVTKNPGGERKQNSVSSQPARKQV